MLVVQSRPPGIYKPAYIKVLAERLNAGLMADIVIPERPEWCNEEGDEDEEAGPGPKQGRRRREVQNDVSSLVGEWNGKLVLNGLVKYHQ